VSQDNTSTITIAYMGRSSSYGKHRFIDIRYFWFKEHLEAKFAELVYLASADLLASIRSEAEFRHFSKLIMGIFKEYFICLVCSYELLERVE
jgi:hypothetical protein